MPRVKFPCKCGASHGSRKAVAKCPRAESFKHSAKKAVPAAEQRPKSRSASIDEHDQPSAPRVPIEVRFILADTTSLVHNNTTDSSCGVWIASKATRYQLLGDKSSGDKSSGDKSPPKRILVNSIQDVKHDFGSHPLFVGVCPDEQSLLDILKREETQRVRVVTHRKEVLEQLELMKVKYQEAEKLDFVCGLESCASELMWEIVFVDQPLPDFMLLLKDRHLWANRLRGSEEFHAHMVIEEYKDATFDRLLAMSEEEFDAFLVEGKAHLEEHKRQVAEIVGRAKKMTLTADSKEFKAYFTMCNKHGSDVANALARLEGCEIGAVGREIEGGLAVALRSARPLGLKKLAASMSSQGDDGGDYHSGFVTQDLSKHFVDGWGPEKTCD